MALPIARDVVQCQDMGTGRPSSRSPHAGHRRQESAIHYASKLNNSDALLWNIERDPSLRTTIVAISVLDRAPDWNHLVDRVLDAVAEVPRLRQRVVAPPLRAGLPRWQDDDRFDIAYHLRRVAVPAPGSLRTVLDIAGPIAMAAFDKDRPLWEFTLVEGMSGGQAALIHKVHHSFTDGVGAVRMSGMLLDSTRRPARRERRRRPPAPTPPATLLTAAADSLTEGVRTAISAPARVVRSMPALTMNAIVDPVGFTRSTARGLRSVVRLLAPATSPLSPTMTERGLSRRLDAFEVPLAALLEAAHAAGASLNDAFLAGVTGGMRRYHERHDTHVESLRVTMPINLRNDDDDLGNNRFTPARFALPVSTVDPVVRMHQLGALSSQWRREPALPLSDAIAGVLDRLPIAATTTLFGSMLKGVDFVATNVPGLRERSFLAGAEVVREYAFAPPSGAAFSIALLSHGETCCFGINVDGQAVPDAEALTECLVEGFAEVVAAVGGGP
jgi:WS/DGAT/MGAT family acyltransferase